MKRVSLFTFLMPIPFLIVLSLLFSRWSTSVFVSEQLYSTLISPPKTLYDVFMLFLDSYGVLPYLPIILVLILFLLFYFIVKLYSKQTEKLSLLITAFFLSITPVFIFSVINLSEGIFVLIFGVVLWELIKRKMTILAFLLAIVLSGFSFIYVLFAYVVYIYLIRKTTVSYSFVFSFMIFLSFIKELFFPTITFISPQFLIDAFLSTIFEFGNFSGISVTLLIIGLIGFFMLFFMKRFISWGIFTLLLVLSILVGDIFLLNFILLLFARPVLEHIITKTWVVKAFKYSSFFVFCIFILFMQIQFISEYLVESPSKEDFLVYSELSDKEYGKILTYSMDAYKFSYYTNSLTFPLSEQERRIFNQILFSTNIESTHEMVLSQNITHVFIPHDFKSIYFDDQEKGLLINVMDPKYFIVDLEQDQYTVYAINTTTS